MASKQTAAEGGSSADSNVWMDETPLPPHDAFVANYIPPEEREQARVNAELGRQEAATAVAAAPAVSASASSSSITAASAGAAAAASQDSKGYRSAPRMKWGRIGTSDFEWKLTDLISAVDEYNPYGVSPAQCPHPTL